MRVFEWTECELAFSAEAGSAFASDAWAVRAEFPDGSCVVKLLGPGSHRYNVPGDMEARAKLARKMTEERNGWESAQ